MKTGPSRSEISDGAAIVSSLSVLNFDIRRDDFWGFEALRGERL